MIRTGTESITLSTFLKSISSQNKVLVPIDSPTEESISGVDATYDNKYLMICGIPTFGFAPMWVNYNDIWTQYNLTPFPLYDISLIDNLGFIVGYNGTIIKWTGGTNLTLDAQSGVITTEHLLSVVLADVIPGIMDWNFAIAVGANGKIIRWESMSGMWAVIPSGTTHTLRCISKDLSNNYWICGDGGIILFSNNFGTTWSVVSSPTTENLRTVSTATTSALIAGANSTILSSENTNGISTIWKKIVSPIQNIDYHSAIMVSNSEAFIIGDKSAILHWDGVNFNNIASDNALGFTKIKGKYPDRLYVTGYGVLYALYTQLMPTVIMSSGKVITPLREEPEEVQVLTNLAVTDTNPHNSAIFNSSRYKYNSFFIQNTLNQNISVQIMANRINSVTGAVTVGLPYIVAAGDNDSATKTTDNDGFEKYYFIKITASAAPASGNVNAYTAGRN